ncbi:MAG: histidine phosphatase family protein [Austwickia sp.]|nr:histidine phosphatase family protein [Austwickia sp.]
MSGRTIVHLLRHGEVHNPDGILYGRLPGYRLSERGRAMADLAAAHLAGRDVTVLASSPMERAQETAAPLVAQFGVPLRIDDRLIEAKNAFEGQRFSAAKLAAPAMWPRLFNPWRPSWGEPYVQIAGRMRAVVEAARVAARGHEAVLVSHQLPIEILRRFVEGERLWHDPRNRRCQLASVTSLEYDGDNLQSVVYAEPAWSLYPGATEVPGA